MIRSSKTTQIETAVRMYVNEARAHGGEMPCIKADMYEVARRVIRLEYDPVTSSHRLPADVDSYLLAYGFDLQTLSIADYEKFYARLDAHEKKASQKQKGCEPLAALQPSGIIKMIG